MHRLPLRKPSPAMAVALVALFAALGGTAVAAKFGPFKGDNIIKKGSLSGNRLKNGTITGTQVNAGTLGKVSSASHADTAGSANSANTAGNADAIGGLTVQKIFWKAATNTTTPQTILDLGGLKLTAACNASGEPVVSAISEVTGAEARTGVITTADNTTHSTGSSSFNSGVTFSAIADAHRGTGTLNMARADGGIVSVNFGFDDTTTLSGFSGCVFSGVAMAG